MTKSSKSIGFATLLFVAFVLLGGCQGGGGRSVRVNPHVPQTFAQNASGAERRRERESERQLTESAKRGEDLQKLVRDFDKMNK